MKRTMTLLIVSAAVLCAQESTVQRLQDVKSIYIAPQSKGNEDVGDMIESKLVSHLSRSVAIVESEEKADAILHWNSVLTGTTDRMGRPHYRLAGAVKLINKDDVVLWADDVSSSRYARSVTSSFADDVAKKLLQAISEEDRKK